MSLPSGAIRRPVAVAMLFLAIVFLGVISFVRIPIDLLPDVAYPRLVVYTQYSDVGPTEVERFVTEPIERGVSRVPGVERVESVSREGISLVLLRCRWGTDMDFAALNVREQIDNLRDELPELAGRPVVLRTDQNSEPVMAISVAAPTDLGSLKELVESVFKRRLEQIDGVAEAALAGGLEREIHIEVDPRLLETYGLTVQDLLDAVDAANQSAPGGTVLRGRYRYALRTLGEFETVDQIETVPVVPRGQAQDSSASGTITIGDVAVVEDGFRDRESMARYNGRESVGLLLFKESGANTVRVAEQVDEVLDQIRRLYPDVTLDVATSQAGFITEAIANVVQALVFGGVLAFLVLFLFLRDPRYPAIVALAIPISVVGTFSLLDLAGVSLNIMSLGGLALGVGMLVDNSIVVLENIFRHHSQGVDADQAARRGAEEVQGAIAASTLTTISVFGPIIYVEGVAGELFGDLSLAVASALLMSLLVALTLLPTLAARWARSRGGMPTSVTGRAARGSGRLVTRLMDTLFGPVFLAFDRQFQRMAEWYHGVLEQALERRGRVVASAVALLIGGVAVGMLLERDVLPDVDQGAFTVRLDLPRGTPIEETAEVAERVERLFLGDPDVRAVFTRVGREEAIAGVEDEESGLHTAVLDVRLRSGGRTREVVDRVRPQLQDIPQDALTVETGTATALGRLLGGDEADLAVRVRGDNLAASSAHAAVIVTTLAALPSLTNVRVGTEEGQPEIRIEIDRERAAAYGVEPRAIATTVEQYMRGEIATDFVDFDEKIPVVVRLPETDRRSLQTLSVLRVDGVPLRELVRTYEEIGPSEVHRLEQGRLVTVFADVAQGGLDGAVEDATLALRSVPPPVGVRVELGGANEERSRAFGDLAVAFGLALLLVYMILAAQFESFIHPFTILVSVPLATVGATFALFAAGEGLNTMSLIGAVILVGIVVNDAIVKVDFINQMRATGLSTRAAILEAGRVRLRPIIMTTVTTVLGLTPMALGIGRGADLRAPLAIAVIGGLISATALTLIVVPVAYDLFESVRERLHAAFGSPAPAPAPAPSAGEG